MIYLKVHIKQYHAYNFMAMIFSQFKNGLYSKTVFSNKQRKCIFALPFYYFQDITKQRMAYLTERGTFFTQSSQENENLCLMSQHRTRNILPSKCLIY